MDQVKVYLGVAKKHHFWILTALVIITSVVVWMKASGALATKYQADKTTIDNAEKGVQGANSPDLPNPKFTTKIDELHKGLKQDVFEAWQKLYERQVALFTWPPLELTPTVDLNRLRPDEEIPEYVRVFYNEKVVQPLWEEVLAEVNLRRAKKQAETEMAEIEEGENQALEYEGLVVWKPEKRQAIISRYFTTNAVPTTVRVRLIQEDVWLFESLVKVVDAVNAGATDPLKAPIKEILTLDIAQWAVEASLQSGAAIWTPDKANAGGASGMGMGANAMGMQGGMAGAAAAAPAGPAGAAAGAGAAGAGAAGAAGGQVNSDNDWLEGRYLDEKGEPLKATADQPYAEFKQMFVYMKFIMDQRRIPDLSAACANAQLPIETRQVRVQTLQSDASISSSGGPFAGGGGFGPGMPGGMGMSGPPPGLMAGPAVSGPDPMAGGFGGGAGMGMPGMGGMPGFGGAELQDGGVETTVYDAVVELSGVIYLYDPPDITKLGTGAAGSPEKRSFGVPTTTVKVPGTSTGGMMQGGMMGGPMGGGPMGGGPMGGEPMGGGPMGGPPMGR